MLDHAQLRQPLLDHMGAMGGVIVGHQHMTFHVKIFEGVAQKFIDGFLAGSVSQHVA